ncbi:MAG TPA: hypothetical protein VF933_18185, partial [Streptosporangiaceae bacterium]
LAGPVLIAAQHDGVRWKLGPSCDTAGNAVQSKLPGFGVCLRIVRDHDLRVDPATKFFSGNV